MLRLLVGCLLGGILFTTGLMAQVKKPLVPAVSIPVQIDRGLVFLPVTINDTLTCTFLFDSGTKGIVIFKDVAGALPNKVNIQKRMLDPRDSLNYGFIRKPLLDIGGLHFYAPKLDIVVRTRMPQMAGHRFDGIIGTALLKAYVVRVDYSKQRLELFDKSTFEGWNHLTPLSVTKSKGIPTITQPFTLQGLQREPNLQLHTGFPDALALTQRYSEKQGLFDLFPDYFYFFPAVSPGHRLPARQVTFPAISLLGVKFMQVPTWLSRREKSLLGHNGADGVIGAPILSQFNVTFDYGRNQVYLEPHTGIQQSLILSWHGLRLVMSPDFSQCLVDDVMPGSPAELAGIQVGDELMAVNGESLAFKNMSEIDALLSGSERLVELHFRHEKLIFRKIFRLAPTHAPIPKK